MIATIKSQKKKTATVTRHMPQASKGTLSRVVGYAKAHPIRVASTVAAVGAAYVLVRRSMRKAKNRVRAAAKNGVAARVGATNGKAGRRNAT